MTSEFALLESRIVALEELASQRPLDLHCLYTPIEAALYLRCGKSNVYDLIGGGAIASTRIGVGMKGLRVRGSAIAAFLESRTEGGPSPVGAYRHLRKHLNQ